MTVHDALFACLGLISAASAICAVTTRQIVHAALWLTVCLATLSGCYLVLGAELVALVERGPLGDPDRTRGVGTRLRDLAAATGAANPDALAAELGLENSAERLRKAMARGR